MVSTDENINQSVPNSIYLLKKAYKERKNSFKLVSDEALLKKAGYNSIDEAIEAAEFGTATGIDNIEKAEQFRNQEVKVAESALHLEDNEILSSELIGFEVVHMGKVVGEVVAVENYGAGDFFEIAITGKEFVLIPNEDDFVLETNVKTRTLVLAPNALESELV